MRILHLIQKAQNRGAETFACQLANHQKNLGHDVKIAGVFEGDGELNWEDKIIILDGNPDSRFIDYRAWKNLNELIQNFNPDIIQANAGDTLKYAVFSKIIFRWETPIIFRNASEVGRYLKSGMQRKFNAFLYKYVDGVISVSKKSEDDILENFSFLDGKTSVIPIGLEKIDKIPLIKLYPKSHKHVIHVGGFTFEKNHKGLIEIFEKVLSEKEDVHLHLIGDGPLRKETQNLVAERKIEKKVSFYGFVNNPLSYIKSGDVLVLPSIIEGLPGVLLEAMYCSVPVISYSVGGIPEIVHDHTGVLIEKGDTEAFSKNLLQILQGNHSPILKENAHKLVLENFMNHQIAHRFIKAYEEFAV